MQGTGTGETKEKGAESPPSNAEGAEQEAEKIQAEQPVEQPPDWPKRYAYLLADFDNFRKRAEREKDAAVRGKVGRLILRIVDLHEGIDKTLASLPPEAKAVREGLEMLLRNLDNLLKEEHVDPLAKVGEEFSLDVHESVGNLPSSDGAREGTVAEIVQQGYRYGGVVLRPAKVLIAHSDEPEKEEA